MYKSQRLWLYLVGGIVKSTSTSSCHKWKSLPNFCFYILLHSMSHPCTLYFTSSFYLSVFPLILAFMLLMMFSYLCRCSCISLCDLLRGNCYFIFSAQWYFELYFFFCFTVIFYGKHFLIYWTVCCPLAWQSGYIFVWCSRIFLTAHQCVSQLFEGGLFCWGSSEQGRVWEVFQVHKLKALSFSAATGTQKGILTHMAHHVVICVYPPHPLLWTKPDQWVFLLAAWSTSLSPPYC